MAREREGPVNIDKILASGSIRQPAITLVKNGKTIPFGVLHTNELITQPVLHDALLEQYRQGATARTRDVELPCSR